MMEDERAKLRKNILAFLPEPSTDALLEAVERTFLPAEVSALSSDTPLVRKDAVFGAHTVASVLEDVALVKARGLLRDAGMSAGDTLWTEGCYRGDKTVWLTPQLCRDEGLHHTSALVKQLIALTKEIRAFGRNSFSLSGDFTVQLAVYDGGGARYVRHKDSFATTHSTLQGRRILTMVYYLNPNWTAACGGHLRVYFDQEPSAHDIAPKADRLVVFRSDVVGHEVLPSYNERIAITFWAYGDIIAVPAALMPSNFPDPERETLQHSPTEYSTDPSSVAPNVRALTIDGEPDDTSLIFVSIASYRDSECQHTLRNLFRTACAPQRLRVGVVLQCDRREDTHCFLSDIDERYKWQVRTLEMHWSEAMGPCWARHIVQSLWQGEPYVFQIDSHMRFRPNWDAYLIQCVRLCEQANPECKPVLTTYPNAYTLPNNVSDDIRPVLLVPSRLRKRFISCICLFPISFGSDGLLRQTGRLLRRTYSQPLPSPLWAAGFNFARSSVIEDVPYDRFLRHIFFGEELSMAARLFTHGYDFFSPGEMCTYHLYSREHRPVFTQVQNHEKKQLLEASLRRLERLLVLTEDNSSFTDVATKNELYGLGRIRTLAEFEARVGVCLRERRVLPGAQCGDSSLSEEHFERPTQHTALHVALLSVPN